MGFWPVRARRIGRREAEELLRSITTSADREDLLRLLALASAPARPEELTGHEAALSAFRTAPAPAVPVRSVRRRTWSLISRALAVKVLAGLGVLLVGGAAVAAGTGNLPTGVQHGAHNLLSPLGVPVPDASGTPAGAHGTGGHPQSPGAHPSAADATSADLCRAWHTEKGDKQGKKMDPAAQEALARAAGGSDRIPDYCAGVLGPDPAGSPTPTPGASPTPGKPGNPGDPGKSHPNPKPSHPAKSHPQPTKSPKH